MKEYKFTSPLEIGDTCWLVVNPGSWKELREFKVNLKVTETKVDDIKFTVSPDWCGMTRSYRISYTDPYKCYEEGSGWYYLYEDSVSSKYLKDIDRSFNDIIFTTKEDAEKAVKRIEEIYRGFRDDNK